ncbi:aspartic peptidase domain-containing protein, partial [Lactarius psammicola]
MVCGAQHGNPLPIYPVSPLLAAVYHVSALHVGVRGELGPHIRLDNGRNLNYMVNITLAGNRSNSDLWVSETIVAAHDTGVLSGLTYAIGAVSGKSIKTAQLEFLGYTVSDQAFLEVSPTSDIPPVPGMLGLGPNTGNAVLDRIFRQNVSTPNILTVLLGRSNDPTERYPGNITVGEILPGLESITSQPQVSVTSLPPLDSEDQHWQVLLDEDGIIGPDGKPIQIQTKVQSTSNPKQLTAVFDTGFSFPQVPHVGRDIFWNPRRIFQFVNGVGQIWLIPCDAEVNLTFKIGGQMYPIHPLDTNSDDAWTTPDGHLCLGAFQPSSSSASGSYDMILGTSFLRNAYLLINFGDFVDGSVNTTADPYCPAQPRPPPPTSTLSNHAAVAAAAASGTTSSKPKNDIKSMFLKEKIPIIIALSIGIGLILLGVLVLCCTRNRLSRRGRDSLASTYKSYQHLGAPAPAGDTQPVQGYRLVPPPAHVNG